MTDSQAKLSTLGKARLEYLRRLPQYQYEKPYTIGYDIPLVIESSRSNLDFEEHWFDVSDVRQCLDTLSLERDGFEVVSLSERLMSTHFMSDDKLMESRGVQSVLKDRFLSELVVVYDHVRRREVSREEENSFNQVNKPKRSIVVRNPHADQTAESGLNRVTTHLSTEEVEKYMSNGWRIRIINFWKPVHHSVVSSPLVFCDPSSISPEDRAPCDVVSHNYVGESQFLYHSPEHRWSCLSNQQLNEAFIFVSYDSYSGGGPEACFHSSCVLADDVGLKPSCPRESMEARAIVITKS
ncbi:hypothetical protein F5Y16DRAFT_419645 [Xylariaceae sp. FL0255]|nr:hypothetical protein F5Y16DRAFT_419645 [Xylariaceae sp. FL0255]